MLTLLASVVALQSPGWAKRAAMGNSNDASVVVNGAPLPDRAVIRNDIVLVPMRPIFEALGADVRWYPENRKVVAHKDGQTISLVLGRAFAETPQRVRLAYPARMVHDRVMVPLRFVSEALGARVHWEPRRRVARVDLDDARRRHDDARRRHDDRRAPQSVQGSIGWWAR